MSEGTVSVIATHSAEDSPFRYFFQNMLCPFIKGTVARWDELSFYLYNVGLKTAPETRNEYIITLLIWILFIRITQITVWGNICITQYIRTALTFFPIFKQDYFLFLYALFQFFFVFQGTLSETREYEIFFFHLVEVLVNDAGYRQKILRFRT